MTSRQSSTNRIHLTSFIRQVKGNIFLASFFMSFILLTACSDEFEHENNDAAVGSIDNLTKSETNNLYVFSNDESGIAAYKNFLDGLFDKFNNYDQEVEIHHEINSTDQTSFRVTGIAVTFNGGFLELVEWDGENYIDTTSTGGPHYNFAELVPDSCPDGHSEIGSCWSYDKDCIKTAVVSGHSTGCTYNSVISSTSYGRTTVCGQSRGCD